MKATGIVRRIDPLGRIVLPAELRGKFDLQKGSQIEISIDGDCIVLQKYKAVDIFTGEAEDLIEYKGYPVSKKSINEMLDIVGLKVLEEPNTEA